VSKPVEVKDDSFEQMVLKSKMPVLVDFWAPWCGPCRMVAPVVDELAQEYDGRVSFGKVNVDDNQDIARKFGIMSIPTLMLFRGGQPISTIVGFRPKDELKKTLDAALS